MLRVRALSIPGLLPHPRAISSWGDNEHSYEPEFWEFQYTSHRYLGRIADHALIERYESLLRNMQALVSPNRHIIPIRSPLSSWYWYRKEHQTRLEFAIRDISLPFAPPDGNLDATPVDAPARPSSPNAGDVLFRYGKRTYMEAMVLQGSVRIGPSSFYRDLELGSARADEECEKHSFMPGQYTKVITQDNRAIPIIGDVRRTVSLPNYYVLCLSCDWDSSLFLDFDADACVVIREPKELAQRLEAAAKKQLGNWSFHDNPVQYFDPYEMAKNEYFDAAMCKDFRFAYQREYRFMWISLAGQEVDDFKYLNLGPLQDIAELYVR